MMATARWQDWTSFVLGLWLAMSPWVLDYTQHEPATANAAFLGLALALAAHFEVSFDTVTAEWLNVTAGLWLVAAPVVLGFAAVPEATVNSVAIGALVAVLAASAMSLDKEIEKFWHRVADPKVADHNVADQ